MWVNVDLWHFLEGRRIACETCQFFRGNHEIVDEEDLFDFERDLVLVKTTQSLYFITYMMISAYFPHLPNMLSGKVR